MAAGPRQALVRLSARQTGLVTEIRFAIDGDSISTPERAAVALATYLRIMGTSDDWHNDGTAAAVPLADEIERRLVDPDITDPIDVDVDTAAALYYVLDLHLGAEIDTAKASLFDLYRAARDMSREKL